MRSFVVLALGLLSSTAAFAGHGHGHAYGHARPAQTQVVYAPAPAPVVQVVVPPVRPGFIWVDGHYEGRAWVAGHWEIARPSVGFSVAVPVVRVDVRR